MSNVIPFPGSKRRIRYDNNNCVGETIDLQSTPANKKFDFTCVCCQNITSLRIDNAIFRSVELFCSKCGQAWRVTNPMFANRSARSG